MGLTDSLSWKVLCVRLKRMYILLLWLKCIKTSIKYFCFIVSLKVTISLLVFYLEDLSINVNGVLQSPTMTDCTTIDPSLYVHQYLPYVFRYSSVGGINVCKGYILLLNRSLYHFVLSFFVSYYSL